MKILFNAQDRAGEFYRSSFTELFSYVSYRIPEIADDIFKIDDAICAGFGWELGPFETWDSVGVEKTVQAMEAAGYKPNQWVYDMLQAGNKSFYKVEGGQRKYYDIPSKAYKTIPGKDAFIILENLLSLIHI